MKKATFLLRWPSGALSSQHCFKSLRSALLYGLMPTPADAEMLGWGQQQFDALAEVADHLSDNHLIESSMHGFSMRLQEHGGFVVFRVFSERGRGSEFEIVVMEEWDERRSLSQPVSYI